MLAMAHVDFPSPMENTVCACDIYRLIRIWHLYWRGDNIYFTGLTNSILIACSYLQDLTLTLQYFTFLVFKGQGHTQ